MPPHHGANRSRFYFHAIFRGNIFTKRKLERKRKREKEKFHRGARLFFSRWFFFAHFPRERPFASCFPCRSRVIFFPRLLYSEKINNAFTSRRKGVSNGFQSRGSAHPLFALIYRIFFLNFRASTIATTMTTTRSRQLGYDIKRGQERVRKCRLKPFSLDRKRDPHSSR